MRLNKNNSPFKIAKKIDIYINTLLVCVFVCLLVTDKRQNGFTDRAQIL